MSIASTQDIPTLINHIKSQYNVSTNSPQLYSYLTHINYSQIKPFLEVVGRSKDKIELISIIKYYDFDRKLRLLMWDGIERIEMSWRSILINNAPLLDSEIWYCNLNNFNISTKNNVSLNIIMSYFVKYKTNLISSSPFKKSKHLTPANWYIAANALEDAFNKLKYKKIKFGDILNSKAKFIANHSIKLKNLVTTEFPHETDLIIFLDGHGKFSAHDYVSSILRILNIPIFLIVNKLTIGQLFCIYKELSAGFRQKIVDNISMTIKESDAILHMEAFVDLRNAVAHHELLFKKQLDEIKNFNYFDDFNSSSTYSYVRIIEYYLDFIAKKNTFITKINNLTYKYKAMYNIDVSYWGFNK